MWHRLRNNFITGVAIIFPVAITIFIIRFLVMILNSYILNPLVNALKINPYLTAHSQYIAKGIIFILVILLIAFIGWAAKFLFLRRFFTFGEKIFIKVPILGKIYSVTKEIGSAFLGHGKMFFRNVVLIEYPRKGLYSIGFTTTETKGEFKDNKTEDFVSVFVPTTPNPTSGIFLLVPKGDARLLDISVEQGMKIVVSSGTIVPCIREK